MDEEEKFEISREEIILFENYYIVLYYICSNINDYNQLWQYFFKQIFFFIRVSILLYQKLIYFYLYVFSKKSIFLLFRI